MIDSLFESKKVTTFFITFLVLRIDVIYLSLNLFKTNCVQFKQTLYINMPMKNGKFSF